MTAHTGDAMSESNDMASDPLRWMLDVANARNDNPKARTVILKFTRRTLDMWRDAASAKVARDGRRKTGRSQGAGMNTEHTPGPWHAVEHNGEGSGWWSVLQGAWDVSHNRAADPGVVADAKYSAMTPAENAANARLIAAAPDLLAALEQLIAEADDRYDGAPNEPGGAGNVWVMLPMQEIETARAVLAKAKGD